MGIIIILLILGSVHSSGRGSCGTPNRPNSNIGKHLGPCSTVESGLRFRIKVQGFRGGNLKPPTQCKSQGKWYITWGKISSMHRSIGFTIYGGGFRVRLAENFFRV